MKTQMKQWAYGGLLAATTASAAMATSTQQDQAALEAQAGIGVGYTVKLACSEVFVAGRDFDQVVADSFFGVDDMLHQVELTLDRNSRSVRGHLFGMGARTAWFREGFGCTVNDGTALPVLAPPAQGMAAQGTAARGTQAQPYPEAPQPEVQQALAAFFPDSQDGDPLIGRGAVVVQNGAIIAEQYRQGFDRDTPQLSWSMAKGVMQALIGIAVGDGTLSLSDKQLMPQWRGGDPRAEITVGQLLHMGSGLQFNELYSAENASDVATMLFGPADMAGFAAAMPLEHAPGTVSRYSSGSSNILSHVLRDRLQGAAGDTGYLHYPQERLFSQIGMDSAVFEPDAAGVFVASSYVYATPRDYARFGQLYLQDGLWQGQRILPAGWVDYTRQPALGSDPRYGSHWFLNQDQSALPGLPSDVTYLFGNEGQFIFVIPSKNAVIVRTGLMHGSARFEQDIVPVVQAIYASLPDPN